MISRVFLLAGTILASVIAASASDYVVVRADRANAEGNDRLILGDPVAFKQVYTPQNFAGPVAINEVAFRLDGLTANGGAFGADIPSLTVTLSVYSGQRSSFTYNTPTQFAETLFSNTVSWRTVDRTDTNPNAFDFSASFSKPYVYDPSTGALVLQFSASTSGGIPALDMHGPGNLNFGWYASSSTPVGGLAGIVVTRFEVTQVPEPRVIAFLLTGFVVVAFLKRGSCG